MMDDQTLARVEEIEFLAEQCAEVAARADRSNRPRPAPLPRTVADLKRRVSE